MTVGFNKAHAPLSKCFSQGSCSLSVTLPLANSPPLFAFALCNDLQTRSYYLVFIINLEILTLWFKIASQ